MADTVAFIIFIGVTLYACFGGADFGAGIWDLFAGGDKRGGAFRNLVDHALGPVWEANHVWLIFVLVFLWTGFPGAFASICETLWIPMSLAALGIVLRGSAFAFRKFAHSIAIARGYGVVFALASAVTPFFFGTVAGAVASGTVPADGHGDVIASWTGSASIIGGIVAVLTCAFLAAVFLAYEASHGDDQVLIDGCRKRAIAAGIITGIAVVACLVPLKHAAPTLFDHLTHRALPLVIISGLCGATTLGLVLTRHLAIARGTALAAVAAVVFGWGVAQYPDISVNTMRIAGTAGAHETLVGLVVVFGLAAVTVIPSLGYLYVVSQRWVRSTNH